MVAPSNVADVSFVLCATPHAQTAALAPEAMHNGRHRYAIAVRGGIFVNATFVGDTAR
jgi:hypothetical protein